MRSPDKVKCHVYWIKHPEHTDIFSQGYVGVTVKPPKYRLSEHIVKSGTGATLSISRAIRKYGAKLILETLLISTQDYCYALEGKLRPTERIGWNVAIGGQVSGTTGRHHSDETKAKMSAANTGQIITEATRAKMSKALTGRKHSEATKARIALGRTGKVHSADTRVKMAAAQRLRREGINPQQQDKGNT